MALDVRVSGAQQVQASVQISKSLKINVFLHLRSILLTILQPKTFKTISAKRKKGTMNSKMECYATPWQLFFVL